MTDDLTTVVTPEPAAPPPAIEADTEVPEIIPEPGEITEPEGETIEEDDGLDDLEFGFKKYRVPKELKGDVEKWRAATTQKEQEVSARQKELEARAAQQSEADETELRHRAVLVDVADKIKPYENLDWLALARQDPVGAIEHKAYFDQLMQAKANAEKGIAEAKSARTDAAQQEYAKRAQETRAFAEKLPGWTPEVDQKLQQFAASKGITPDFVRQNMSPLFYELMHLAWHGEQSLKRATAAVAGQPQLPSLTPLEKVSGKSSPNTSRSLVDLAKDNKMDDFAKNLLAKMDKKAGRR